jgi:hypothetical protein
MKNSVAPFPKVPIKTAEPCPQDDIISSHHLRTQPPPPCQQAKLTTMNRTGVAKQS